MTLEELQQENDKLNARLQKAATVFNEQKATIKRLTEERDAAVAKTSEAEGQDELFFEQQQEIENLKSEKIKLDERLTKAGEAYTKLKGENASIQDELSAANEKLNSIRQVLG